MNKKIYFDDLGNIVLNDGNIVKVIFNKNQIDALEMVIEKVISNKLL